MPGARGGAAALRLLQNLGGAVRDSVLFPLEARASREWVGVRLDRGLTETAAQSPFLESAMQLPRSFSSVLDCLERIVEDTQVSGVLLRVGQRPLGWAKTAALVRAIGDLRSAGRSVVVYGEATGNAGAWLGSLADCFWIAPAGRVDLVGVHAESPFLRGLLDQLQIRPDVLAAGRYKSAGEMIARESMSESAREALDAVVGELYDALVGGLAAGRAGSLEEARRWVDEGPYLASEAREIGLVDDLVYADEIPRRLAALSRNTTEGTAGGAEAALEAEVRVVDEAAYLRLSRERFRWRPVLGPAPRIALLSLGGIIRQRAGSARNVIAALGRLRKDSDVRAVVLRVDSPGGDPLTSDLVWRAVRRLAEEKPVVASMGDTAASGGYYAAMGANEIVAEATTLTGSIGVVLLSIELDAFLERFGVRFDGVSRGRNAGIYSTTRARTDEERAHLQRHVEALYRDFVAKAAEARGVDHAALDCNAQGRVWTGHQARERGLVDAIGGLDTAVRRARALAGLGEREGEPFHVSTHQSALRRLLPADPLEAGASLKASPQLLCPHRIPIR